MIANGNDGEFAGKRILLVEDIELNREIVISILSTTGVTVDVAINGEEAVKMIADAPNLYDLVFMDIQMPVMDGIEATKQIRAMDLQRNKILPILALTANLSKKDVENYLAAGMDDCIGKPVDVNLMFEKLRSYM